MAFWGVEIKPGCPYRHRRDEARGRLHVSQATLGSGKSTKKVSLQCDVGDEHPVLLCTLLPKRTESCPLNLEFEEEDDVVFSVIGPQSVHLTGFYLEYRDDYGQHGDDSYSEDIDETETDQSSDYDSEDEFGDDFMVDDDDDGIEMFPSSSRPNSGVTIEEIFDDEKPANGHSATKNAKKKSQATENGNSDHSQKQIAVKSFAVPISESEDEDGFPVSIDKNVDAEDSLDKTAKEGGMEETKNDGNEVACLKRKIDSIDGGDCDREGIDFTENPDATTTESSRKSKKKKKSRAKETLQAKVALSDGKEASDPSDNGIGATYNEKEVAVEGVDQDPSSAFQETNEKPLDDEALGSSINCDGVGQSECKEKKKKKSKTHRENTDSNALIENANEQKSQVRPSKPRTFSNGLVIEEISMGKPDGRKASPGNKVSVHYIGKLKKSEEIFDSNIGRRPFKFRLGIGQVIKGWDVGLVGMRVGDKRRLTIPPSMGYGDRGAGKIPANAWLVFDVELVAVQ